MPSCRVLIVDDDHGFQEILSDALASAGIEAVCVDNGSQALKWLKENPAPTVILLDLHMPVMDGSVFYRTAQEQGFNIPTIVMSGAYSPKQYAKDLGAEGYVNKPFDPNDLFNQIGRFLRDAGKF